MVSRVALKFSSFSLIDKLSRNNVLKRRRLKEAIKNRLMRIFFFCIKFIENITADRIVEKDHLRFLSLVPFLTRRDDI